MTDDTARADSPEQTHSPEYNRGWADGNASALDACNPVIEALQAQLAARPSGLLREAGPEKFQCGNCGDWLRPGDIIGHGYAEGRDLRAALAADEPGLDVERLAAILMEIAPLRYADSWPDDDPEIVGPYAIEEARQIASRLREDAG